MKSGFLNLIIVVLMIPLLGITFWLVYSRDGKEIQTSTQLVVTKEAKAAASEAPVLSAKSKTIKETLTKTNKTIGDLILVENSQFTVDYMIYNDQFLVRINQASFADNKLKAESWFKDQGFKETDLCLLRISYITPRTVKETLSATDVVPTGCAS